MDLVKCQNVMVLFAYLQLITFFLLLVVLTGSGGSSPRLFMIHVSPYQHLHLNLLLPLLNIHNICSHRAPLSIFIPLTLPYHFPPTHAPLSLPLTLLHHLHPPCVPIYISLPIHLPHPPSLS